MLPNFEEITQDLNSDEIRAAKLIKNLLLVQASPIKAKQLIRDFKDFQRGGFLILFRIDEPRIRKIINYICKNWLPNLIGTSKGYYVTNDVEELKRAATTLQSRANENNRRAECIWNHLKSTYGLHEK